jgi:Helix-turn-helix domain
LLVYRADERRRNDAKPTYSAALSPRIFFSIELSVRCPKVFKAELGHTPADFVERLRLDEARRRLEADNSIDNVGLSVGFKSADAFRRAFERRLGINPSDYRRRLRIVPLPPWRRELNRTSVAKRSDWSFPHPITGKLAV